MQRANAMRQRAIDRGDQAFGAVIVKDGRIVGEGVSAVIVHQDPTAHGEMEAIRDACRRLGTRDLSGCVMYSTARPCPMCETAAYWAHIEQVYYGTEITDAGSPRYPAC
jgi:tRNA(Arg) A34 adenosine deaminase TadA